jgi:hypothetical protein
METYITRIWLNNCNNYIISDCPDKHAAAVVEMVAKGGTKLDSNVCTYDLGEVRVVRKIDLPNQPTNRVVIIMLQAAREIYAAQDKLLDIGIQVEPMDKASGAIVEGLVSLFDYPEEDENGFQIDQVYEILGTYLDGEVDVDDCLCKFYQYLFKHSVIGDPEKVMVVK